jgi:hypothetical protein
LGQLEAVRGNQNNVLFQLGESEQHFVPNPPRKLSVCPGHIKALSTPWHKMLFSIRKVAQNVVLIQAQAQGTLRARRAPAVGAG